MKEMAYKIEKDYKHVYYFLKDMDFSEAFITLLRKNDKSIMINNSFANTKSPLSSGDILKIALDLKEKSSFLSNNEPIDIVFEDDYILVVNKPSGVSCSPSRSHYSQNLAGSILGYMQQKDPNFVLRMKNRLDKDTAGLVIVAKDILTYNKLENIDKTYHAICSGIIDKNLTLDFKIKTIVKDNINELKRVVSEDGKSAKTFVTPIKKLNNSTLLSLKLENGRTHQIRVHLSHINHPLIGDEIYGKKSKFISHTALICDEISFLHPTTKKKINLKINFPKDFENLIKILS